MRKFASLSRAIFPLALAALCLHGSADARPGGGRSIGSRGSHSWSAPPRTSLTPNWARPMDESATPRLAPNYGMPPASMAPARPMPGYGGPVYRQPYPMRHPFMTGFAGGFLGAGLFGILSGHGAMGGMTGGSSFFGFLLQVLIIGGLIAFVLRRLGARGNSKRVVSGGIPSQTSYNAGSSTPVTLTNDDYLSFQRLLLDIQAAWSAQNMPALSSMATPEMVGYFNAQLSDLASRGARNIVSDVRFQSGDLSEAWREGGFTYATVAMRYSMIDVTTDSFGHVIDGSSTEQVTVTELWTFVRTDGRGNWVLSAIQQAG